MLESGWKNIQGNIILEYNPKYCSSLHDKVPFSFFFCDSNVSLSEIYFTQSYTHYVFPCDVIHCIFINKPKQRSCGKTLAQQYFLWLNNVRSTCLDSKIWGLDGDKFSDINNCM